MEKPFEKTENLATSIRDYITNRIETAKLGIAEKTSGLLANLAAGMVVVFVLLFFLVFGGIALALVLGHVTGHLWLGFLLTAGIYLLIGILVWAGRNQFIRLPVMNGILRQLTKDNEDEKD